MIVFENPSNGYRESIEQIGPKIGVFFLGGFYLIFRGLWHDLIIWLLIVLVGFSIHFGVGIFFGILTNVVYIFIINSRLEKFYWRKGWKRVKLRKPSCEKEGS